MIHSSMKFAAFTTAMVLCGMAFSQAQPRGGAQMPGRESGAASDTSAQLRQFAQDPKTAAEKLFILHAGMANQMEIEFSRQVQQKAQNQQVKQFAQHIIDDHQKANEQLQRMAQQLNVQLPQSLPEEKQEMIRVITSLPADQMEKHYITAMQADHAGEVIKFRACSQTAQNPAVKDYAQKELPTLAQHYDQAQQTAVALGLPSGGPEAVPASGRISPSNTNTGRTGDMTVPNSAGGSSGSNNSAPISGRTGGAGTGGTGTAGTGSTGGAGSTGSGTVGVGGTGGNSNVGGDTPTNQPR